MLRSCFAARGVFALVWMVALLGSPTAGAALPAKISTRLWRAVQQTPSDVIVTALGYPDLSRTVHLPDKQARTRFVVEALRHHADQSQAALQAALRARGLSFEVLWVSNQILVRRATRADVLWLSRRADVAHLDHDVPVKGLLAKPVAMPRNASSSLTWGVQRVRAPEVWALGYRGQGIVIANLDTGVYWAHNLIKPNYRGWNGITANHDYHWFDAAPEGAQPPASEPVDLTGHGTHTVGTSNGVGGIGVAPEAKWIACRNMAGTAGIGSVARYTACFQFALAPTDRNGNNPNPDLAADITSNSWACDPNYGEEGCDVPTALVTATQALRAAGIMVIAAAGNSGPGCSTVSLAPATLDQAFTVGATNSADGIAGFSSRGPSTLTGRLKPDVVAPGVGVNSAWHTGENSQALLSGTSMATPHVAGVAALVWSAAPWLRGNVEGTEQLLRATARPLTTTAQTCGSVPGTQVPNNTFGYGLVDARNAVSYTRVLHSDAPQVALAGTPITYTVVLTNVAPFVRSAVVTATLPMSASLVFSDPPASVVGQSIVWAFATLAPGAVVSMTYAVQHAQSGWVSNAPLWVHFADLPAPVPGRTAHTFLEAQRYWLPLVRVSAP
ncbi:MAG: S8 family serine peptidase [Thermoflexales bacterium]|nr:S8 family serine peptidase [Thermoflexales bacterium]